MVAKLEDFAPSAPNLETAVLTALAEFFKQREQKAAEVKP